MSSDTPNENLAHVEGQYQKAPVGARLKKAREEKGISLESVHEALKVPLDALRAIEEGYTIRTLSPFYYKGFVKIYGEFLEVDVSDVLEAPRKESPTKALEEEYKQFFIRDILTNIITTRRIQQALVILFGLLLMWGLFKGIQALFGGGSDKDKTVKTVSVTADPGIKPKVKVVAKPKPKPKPVSAPATPVQRPAPTPVDTSSAVTLKQGVTKNVTLVVRAKKNSWLRVKEDGNVVFQSTLGLGSVEAWRADESIEISGKNLDQLEFDLNGNMIGTLGRKDRDAKTLIFTKNGLEVRK